MAYGGARPSEPLGLRWRDVGEQTLYIAANKNVGRATEERWVRLLAPLAQDLREWRLASGRLSNRAPSCSPPATAAAGARRRASRGHGARSTQAVKAAKVEHLPPKDLRHAFASLLAHEGRSGPYIADQLGHGLEVSQSTHQHILRELEDQPASAPRTPSAPPARVGGRPRSPRAVRTEYGWRPCPGTPSCP